MEDLKVAVKKHAKAIIHQHGLILDDIDEKTLEDDIMETFSAGAKWQKNEIIADISNNHRNLDRDINELEEYIKQVKYLSKEHRIALLGLASLLKLKALIV